MGCTPSTPNPPPRRRDQKNMGIGATEHFARRSNPKPGIGHTEHLLRKTTGNDNKNVVVSSSTYGNNSKPPALDADGNLTPEEVEKRVTCSPKTKSVRIGDVTYKYAYVTQRGYYPDDPQKPNQDAHSITTAFGGVDDSLLFAVYDGHGDHGDDCAQFAKKQLPRLFNKYVRQERAKLYKKKAGTNAKFNPTEWPPLTGAQLKKMGVKAHLECNEMMHEDKTINDSFSGTTAISIAIHGPLLTIFNVGDSRALLGHRPSPSPNKLHPTPLSSDQTPYRADERLRVKKRGARVMTLDQLHGKKPPTDTFVFPTDNFDKVEDPPRIFAKDKPYPGTAFTRSMGDKMAEELCGVIADPEVVTRTVGPEDEVLIVASDGIFEFTSEEEVMGLVEGSGGDPLVAGRRLVARAYENWCKYEIRTDDITVIVVFLDRGGDETTTTTTTTEETTTTKETTIPLPQSRRPEEERKEMPKDVAASNTGKKGGGLFIPIPGEGAPLHLDPQ